MYTVRADPYLSSKTKPMHHPFCTSPDAHWAELHIVRTAPLCEPPLSLIILGGPDTAGDPHVH